MCSGNSKCNYEDQYSYRGKTYCGVCLPKEARNTDELRPSISKKIRCEMCMMSFYKKHLCSSICEECSKTN